MLRLVRRQLLFELTETQVVQDLAAANGALQALRKAGHAICLDDFGAGAASLDYIRRLDVDFVKIDGRYIQSLAARGRDATILKHIVGLCRDLDVATIGEMVETVEAARLARSIGVGFGQGWHFGKPGPLPIPTVDPSQLVRQRRGIVGQWS